MTEQMELLVAAGGNNDSISELARDIDTEVQVKARQTEENVRRRHNFTPFVIALLKGLARNASLLPIVNAAIERRDSTNR